MNAPRDVVNPATGQIVTTTANRWDSAGCGLSGCPCDHDPHSVLGSCDHGWTSPDGDGKARKCRRCRAYAQSRPRKGAR